MKPVVFPVERPSGLLVPVEPEVAETELLKRPQIILTAQLIQEFVALSCNTPIGAILAIHGHSQEVLEVRKVAMYLCREIPTRHGRKRTYEEIAKAFPPESHATALNWCQGLRVRMSIDPVLAKQVNDLMQKLLDLSGQKQSPEPD
jgi:chromosomal replication initiation ATPase DnaA